MTGVLAIPTYHRRRHVLVTAALLCLALCASLATAMASPARAVSTPFIDISPGQKFAREIQWMHESGLSTGVRTPQGIAYLPKHNLSREAMAAFLFRASGEGDYVAPPQSPFRDVKQGHKFYREIMWMWQRGLTTGVSMSGGREYRPTDRLTREAMAAFLYRNSNAPAHTPPSSSPFLDLAPGQKFYKEITWMASSGLTSGVCTPRGREYFPKSKLTREAMAAFMYRQVRGTTVSLNNCPQPDVNMAVSTAVVINKHRGFNPANWAPSDLVMPNGIANHNGQPLRAEAAHALERMHGASIAETGGGFSITSGFRDYNLQASLYNSYIRRDGQVAADRYSARPGFSEHQTGLTADLDDGTGCTLSGCFGSTAAGFWLKNNAHRFGYIMRYQPGQESIVGYMHEPWHFRYVGVGIASDMHARGFLNLETYLGLPPAPDYR